MPLARILAVKNFERFLREERLTDEALVDAVESIELGKTDAKLGGGLFKQRIARKGEGKSGGFRTVVVFRRGERAVFVEGYAKNVKKVHSPDELKALRFLADRLLALSEAEVDDAIAKGGLREIKR